MSPILWLLPPTKFLSESKSIAVNPADPIFAELGRLARCLVRPHPIPGMDFSGEVVATGSNVTSVNIGDRVFGRVETQKGQAGCMAEYTRAEIEGCVPIPPGIDWGHAAGAGTAAITAYESLVLNSKPGDLVFINGGAGGVGTFAIQFAKAHGCRIIASCSTAKIGICKELGADEVIDYPKEDLVSVLKEKGKVIDLVVDYAYREEVNLYKASHDFLADGATFVMVPGGLSSAILRVVSKNSLCPHMLGGGKAKFKAYFAKSNRTAFQQISEWMAAGKVRTVIDSVFEFDDMPRAIERINIAQAFTKVVTSFVSDIILPIVALLPFLHRNMDEKFAVLRRGPHYVEEKGYNTLEQARNDGALVLAYGAFLETVISFVGVSLTLYAIGHLYTWISHDQIIKQTVQCKYCRKYISEKALRCVNCTSWQDGREDAPQR
ncbi:hypothetical protein KXV47_006070 [Aspergillus fumigatus]|nr:hypothetical protein KXV47_006070 [Aspergillus fumigatus]